MIMTLREKSQGYNEVTVFHSFPSTKWQIVCHFVDGKQISHTNSKRFKFIHFVARTKFWPKTWVMVTGLGRKTHETVCYRHLSWLHGMQSNLIWTCQNTLNCKSCLITLRAKELPRRTYRGRVLWLCSRWYRRLCGFLVFRGT